MKAVVATLGGLSIFLATHSSEATGEAWLTMMNCHPTTPTANTSWGVNEFGYYNTNTSTSLSLHCAQPRISNINGYAESYASGYNRNSTGTTVSLCYNDGTGSTYNCDDEPMTSIGSYTLTFAATSVFGSNPLYRYWKAVLPPYDTNNGSSHLTSVNYNDN